MFVLRVTGGPRAGDQIVIDRDVTLGREGVEVVIDDPELSRRHAAVRVVEGHLEIEDMGSLNGTLVNNLLISSATRLGNGDLIEVGATILEVESHEDDPGKTVARMRPSTPPEPAPTGSTPVDDEPTAIVSRDPTEIDHEVAPVPSAGAAQAAPAMQAPPETVRFLYSGQRLLLGETSTMYGIWDRSSPGTPVESFPRTDEGWSRAWLAFSPREPAAQPVSEEARTGSPAPTAPLTGPKPPSGASAAAGPRTGGVTGAGVILLILGALNGLGGFAFLSIEDPTLDEGVLRIAGVISLVVGAAAILAGILVLQRKPAGRILGFVVAGVVLLAAILWLIQGQRLGGVSAALAAITLNLLIRNRAEFDRR